MKTTPTIPQLLTLSEGEYEDKILNLWLRYCAANTYAVHKNDYQKLVACTALNKWWLRELGAIEEKFLEDYGAFAGKIEPTVIMKLYNEEVIQLFKLHSLPLFQYARKLNVIPQLN